MLDDSITASTAPRRAAVTPLRSTVREVAPSDPVREFAAGWARTGRGFLWWRPAEGFALVGAGAALSCQPPAGRPFAGIGDWWAATRSGIRREERAADPATGPMLFCAVAFDPADERSAADAEWRSFPPAAAVLPVRMVTLRGGRAWLTVNEPPGADLSLTSADPAPTRPDPDPPDPTITVATDLPQPAGWARRVRQLTEAFARGEAEKVVLARTKRVMADGAFVPERVLRRLAADHAESTVFAIGWGDRCFLGATPELLVRTRGTAVLSGALAGSRPRGRTAAEDECLAADLQASDKDGREHRLVVDAVAAALAPLCRRVDVAAAPVILRLPNVQHLLTRVAGEASAAGGLLAFAERLHPTPAVGGVPRAAAVAAIRRLEPRSRGWYAGSIGWVDATGDGDFAVALRSGVVRGRTALLYAGCGVVAGSDPEREYAETEVKFAPLLAALGAGPT